MKSLKGSTIIETIVALVLLLLISGIVFIIYSNLFINSKDFLKLEANSIANEISISVKKDKIYLDEETHNGNLNVKKSFKEYKDLQNVVVLSIVVTDMNNVIVLSRKEIITQ
jgi:hypothetical protein